MADLGTHAAAVIKAAKAIGKWVHVGRVNTPERWLYFDKLGADSVDGTGIAQYSHMRQAICEALHQPNLLTGLAPDADEYSAQSGSSTAETVSVPTGESIGKGEWPIVSSPNATETTTENGNAAGA